MTALAFSNATGVSPPDAFERIDLSFSPSLFCCGGCFPGETPQHSGCTVTRFDGHYTMKVYVKDCPVDSSLIHEFLHVMSYEVLGELDADHQNPKIWAKNINQPELNPGAAFWLAKAAGYSSGLCDAL